MLDEDITRCRRTSMKIDANDFIHVVYTGNYELVYGNNTEGEWIFEQIPNAGYEGDRTLNIDASGKAHIIVEDEDGLQYVTNVSGNWEIELIDSSEYIRLGSLEIDDDGNVHVVYGKGYTEDLFFYAQKRDGNWEFTDIGQGRSNGSLYMDNLGFLHSVHHTYHGPVYYSTNSSGSWHNGILDKGGDTFSYCSFLGLGTDGLFHTIYGGKSVFIHTRFPPEMGVE